MPFVPVPATVKVSLFYTMDNQQCMNRIHVSTSPTLPSAGDCATIAAAVAGWWLGNVQPLVSNTLSLRAVEAVSIAEPNGPQAVFSAGLPVIGAKVQDPLPNSTALAVSLRSGLTGRSARGRWFWLGFTEDQIAGNVVNAGVATSIVAAMDNLLSTITGLSAFPAIVSYIANGVPRPGGPVKFFINDALVVDTIVDTQRRRLPGRGT